VLLRLKVFPLETWPFFLALLAASPIHTHLLILCALVLPSRNGASVLAGLLLGVGPLLAFIIALQLGLPARAHIDTLLLVSPVEASMVADSFGHLLSAYVFAFGPFAALEALPVAGRVVMLAYRARLETEGLQNFLICDCFQEVCLTIIQASVFELNLGPTAGLLAGKITCLLEITCLLDPFHTLAGRFQLFTLSACFRGLISAFVVALHTGLMAGFFLLLALCFLSAVKLLILAAHFLPVARLALLGADISLPAFVLLLDTLFPAEALVPALLCGACATGGALDLADFHMLMILVQTIICTGLLTGCFPSASFPTERHALCRSEVSQPASLYTLRTSFALAREAKTASPTRLGTDASLGTFSRPDLACFFIATRWPVLSTFVWCCCARSRATLQAQRTGLRERDGGFGTYVLILADQIRAGGFCFLRRGRLLRGSQLIEQALIPTA